MQILNIEGVGKKLVGRFHSDGAVVLALDKNSETIHQLRSQLPNVVAEVVDITDWESTKRVIESFGDIHHVVNNAAIVKFQKFMDITKESALHHFDVNTLASINVTQAASKGMIERGNGGSIVNIGSISGKLATDGLSMYCASKAAMEMLTKSMSLELGPYNIRANCIAPTMIKTTMEENSDPEMVRKTKEAIFRTAAIKRAVETDEIVDLVMFLLSPLSAMITGESVNIDGGCLSGFGLSVGQ
ncbi:Carbonyl reductase [NADPH] 2 [Orchesella cincta]|uniref:Carbonyl reductase [NADPH] 2 n=1 Tax=Orchesella cincta TaxID=48709 RepID=A0A1D2MMV1_ORCCI|nr:Carbonyl reductase [NADPH] 2 [Orchesella cincta]